MAANLDPTGSAAPEPFGGNLDLKVMDQLLDLDDGAVGLLKEMFGLFQQDTPERMQGIEALLPSGDGSAMADLAHAIKGAAGTMGVHRLRTLAAEFEGSARKNAFTTPPESLVAQMKVAYADALVALEAFIASKETQP
jgi:HPt (histidine-containing phosphotransfer) domain-containing protein